MLPTDCFTDFSTLPLHDDTLIGLRFDWKERTCVAEISGFDPLRPDALHLLIWSGVSETLVPHHKPWEPSCFIHSVRFEAPDLYLVEMGSGDQIAVTAEGFRLAAPPD